MFQSIDGMTDEEKLREIEELEQLLAIKRSTSVDHLLMQQIDTSLLAKHELTLTPNGEFFDVRKHGFLPEMMETVYSDRSKYKKQSLEAKKELEAETDPVKRFEIEKKVARYHNLQLAKKVCLNSAYGALGNQYFRFFDIRQASAITTAGQLSIRWIEKHINEYMNNLLKTEDKDYVIAADTDSIYLHLGGLVDKVMPANSSVEDVINFMDRVCDAKIRPFINETYGKLAEYINAYQQKMRMKREALADKGIWTAKKRYILNVYDLEGVRFAKPKIKVTGLEMIKSSTPSACRDKLKESIEVIFNQDEDAMIEFIDNFREDFKKCDLADIAFPRGVNGLEKYAGKGSSIYGDKTPIHVRGSLIFNHMLVKNKLNKKYVSIKEGEKIKFIYLKEPNPVQSNVISFSEDGLPEEFGLGKYIDYNTQFDKSFLEPLKIILDSIGWKTERVSSLARFFS